LLQLLCFIAAWGNVPAPQLTADFRPSVGFPDWISLVSAIGYFELAAGLLLVVGGWARTAALGVAAFTAVASVIDQASDV